MSEREGLRFEGTMTHMEFLSKFKRFNPLEPSLAILGFFFATLLFVACFFYSDFRGSLGLRSRGVWWLRIDGSSSASYSTYQRPDFLDQASDGCDVFDGNWVWDESYPLYQSTECDFLDEGFRCTENGRTDSFFTHWRWQPKDCNLPRFDAITMLEKLRNQRVVFAGDSIGRNQWESLLCMLSSAIPNKTSIYEVNGRPITKHTGFLVYKFEDFNCTLEYYRAPFLVLQSRAPAGSPENVKLTVKLDQMDWSSGRWKGADVLILNTGHWWNVEKTTNVGCYFQEGDNVSTEMSVENAYRRSMETVVDFLGTQVNMTKTRVFFRTYAPIHFIGGDWKTGGTCHLEKLPDLGSLPDSSSDPHFKIALDVLSEHANEPHVKRLDVLNVTGMSSRRKDGHASIYYLGPEVGPASVHRQDCSHWCLPGVPDSWNELMYAVFMKREYEYASAQNSTNSTRPM